MMDKEGLLETASVSSFFCSKDSSCPLPNYPRLTQSVSKLSVLLKDWKKEDDTKLINLVDGKMKSQVPDSDLMRVDWQRVGAALGKSAQEAFSRYTNALVPSINKAQWSSEEEKKLLELVTTYQEHNWFAIAKDLGTGRTALQCVRHFQQSLNHKLVNSSEWTSAEDLQLKEGVEMLGTKQWQVIADQIPGRTASQCLNRWKKVSQTNAAIRKGGWNEKEERDLFLAVVACDVKSSTTAQGDEETKDIAGVSNWKTVADLIVTKSEVQCREKWTDYMDPRLTSTEFSEEEVEKLKQLVAQHGAVHSWAKIAKSFPGKSTETIRLFWEDLMKREGEPLRKKRKILPRKHLRRTAAAAQVSEEEVFQSTKEVAWIQKKMPPVNT